MRQALKYPIVTHIASAVGVAVSGFILLNLTFLLDFLFQNAIDAVVSFPPFKHVMFMIMIGLISWPIFRSKLRVFFKAAYMTVPLAVVFATLGMFLFPWPPAAYIVGSLFSMSVLYYLYRTKQPWLYYYTLVLVSLTMLLVGLSGVEI
jgi:hypothetical protein